MLNKKDSYDASSIKSYEGIEGIRAHPGMYIGDVDSYSGYHHLLYEVLDNSIDEFVAGYGDIIEISISNNLEAKIRDYGRGIPVDAYKNKTALEAILEDPHTGGKSNAENNAYKISGGLHGIGLKAVVALSEHFKATVYRNNRSYTVEYREGIKQGGVKSEISKEKTGTEIIFKPSYKIFNNLLKFEKEVIQERINSSCYLNNNLKISLKFNEEEKNVTQYTDGLKEMILVLTNDKQIFGNDKNNIFVLENSNEKIDIKSAFCWLNEIYGGFIKGYTNNIPQVSGTHITGFSQTINKKCIEYIESEFKTSIKTTTVKNSMVGIISIKIKDPKFASQNKEKLTNEYVRTEINSLLSEKFDELYSLNSKNFKPIFKELIQQHKVIEKINQIKQDSVKQKISFFNLDNTRLTDAYDDNPENKELFIVEGTSATGPIKGARNPKTQGILSLRGKPLNIIRKQNSGKISMNNEIQSIISAIGNQENPRYSKIFILADKDKDGDHIRGILLGFFLIQMPKLIEKNMLFVSVPPLYKISSKNSKQEIFLQTYQELCNYIVENHPFKNALTENLSYVQKEVLIYFIKHRFIKKIKNLEIKKNGFMYKGIFVPYSEITKDMYLIGYNALSKNISVNPYIEITNYFNNKIKNYSITRFKGLGEMNIEQIKPVIDPLTRTAISVKNLNINSTEFVKNLIGDNVMLRKNMVENLNLIERE